MKHSRNTISRFIPILLVIVITIVAVAAVVMIGQAIFNKKQPLDQQNQSVDQGKTALLSVDVSRSVKLTVRGPIRAQENFRSYTIEISPDSRVMTTYKGYLAEVIKEERLGNNAKAYEELVYSLNKRKMMDGKQLTEKQNDLRGVCARANIYKFETLNDGAVVKTLWTSDCGGAKGSAEADVNEIIDMFLKQVPNGKKMVQEIGLTAANDSNPFKL